MDTHYIHEVLKGNTEAYGYLIRTYQNKAFEVAISIVKQEEDAKDVVQESFITAYLSISQFNNDAKFSTWFYRIIVNTSLQFLRKKKRKYEIVEEFSVSDEKKTAYNIAINKLEKHDLKNLIKKVFEKIPAKEALVLQLFYIDDQSITEIVEISGFTKTNVKVLLHRGRNSFYKILEDKNINNLY